MIDTYMVDTSALERKLEGELPEKGEELTVRVQTTIFKLVLLLKNAITPKRLFVKMLHGLHDNTHSPELSNIRSLMFPDKISLEGGFSQ